MKVIKWTSYDEAAKMPLAIDTLGGFFDNGMRWPNLLDAFEKECEPYLEALRASIIEKQLRYNGQDHQNAEDGAPIFEDGNAALFSFRAWGDLMAAIWSSHENKDYTYMDFYC